MKKVTGEQLKKIFADLPHNPRVVASGNFATPHRLLDIFSESVPEFRLHMLNAQKGIPDRPGIEYETAFVGPGMRHHPRLNYLPSRLSLLPVLIRDYLIPDVVLLHTSKPRFDTVSLGIEVNVLPAAIEAVHEHGGIVVAQANQQMPYTYGDAQIYEHEIDYLVEIDEELAVHQSQAPSQLANEIGSKIAEFVSSGSTLQLGIGSVPDAVVDLLNNRTGLRIWSEMFSDGVYNLEQNGALDQEIPITASFIFGSSALYNWVNLNRRIRMLRTEKSNDPSRIASQAKMTSINSAMQIDLFDQANASRIGDKIYSGFGGSTDFIVGALHSRGGKSFMALPSWHHKTNTSKIIPKIETAVTSFQHSYVVTENGVAPCFGESESNQAKNIIEYAAHPNARPALWEAAEALGLR
jgi:acyl-CoA hydrolase